MADIAEDLLRRIRDFSSAEVLKVHYEKHNEEFGVLSVSKYLRRANELADRPLSGDVVSLERSDGSISKYCFSPNEFVVVNSDGTIRTFFKPESGEEYWNYELERN